MKRSPDAQQAGERLGVAESEGADGYQDYNNSRIGHNHLSGIPDLVTYRAGEVERHSRGFHPIGSQKYRPLEEKRGKA